MITNKRQFTATKNVCFRSTTHFSREYIYNLFVKYWLNILISSDILSSKEWNNNITPKHIAKYVKNCISDMYLIIVEMPINFGYSLPTMLTPFGNWVVSEI